jgi:hypothetical protein
MESFRRQCLKHEKAKKEFDEDFANFEITFIVPAAPK